MLDRRSHAGGNVHDSRPPERRAHPYVRSTLLPHQQRPNLALRQSLRLVLPLRGRRVDARGRPHRALAGVGGVHPARRRASAGSPAFRGEPRNFEEASLAMMPEPVYAGFVKGYSEKQWGVPASSLDAGLARRFDVCEDDDVRAQCAHKHQGIPDRRVRRVHASGCSRASRCSSTATTCSTGTTSRHRAEARVHRPDRRALRLRPRPPRTTAASSASHEHLAEVDRYQPVGQVNNPDPANGAAHPHAGVEAHDAGGRAGPLRRHGASRRETPFSPTDPSGYEYPFPDAANADAVREATARRREGDGRRARVRPARRVPVLRHGPGHRPGDGPGASGSSVCRPRRDIAA